MNQIGNATMQKAWFLVGFQLLIGSYWAISQSNYLDYHLQFNEIEERIVEEQFDQAQRAFEDLFNHYDVKFVKDYVIAAQISLLANKKQKALEWLLAAIQKGAKIKCLKSIRLLSDRLTSADWQAIELQEQAARRKYLQNINITLYQDWHKRYQDEQLSKSTDYYKAIVYSNFDQIKKTLDTGVFLSETEIGIDDQRWADSIADCELGNSKIIVTLLHYDYPIAELGLDKMLLAIKRGELHPREFAMIYNYERNQVSKLYQKSNKSYADLPDYQFNFPFGKIINDTERVNQDRKKFGICKYQIDLKKQRLAEKYGLQLDFNYK